jgi:hypothetical protein
MPVRHFLGDVPAGPGEGEGVSGVLARCPRVHGPVVDHQRHLHQAGGLTVHFDPRARTHARIRRRAEKSHPFRPGRVPEDQAGLCRTFASDDYVVLANRHGTVQIVRSFPDQDRAARAACYLASGLQGLRIIQSIIGPGAEVLNLDRDIDLGNAALHAALGPVGIDDPVRPDDIRCRQAILLLRLDLILVWPGRILVGAPCDIHPGPQSDDQDK